MIPTKDNKHAIGITRNKDEQVYLAVAHRSPAKIVSVPITDIEAVRLINELQFEFNLYPPRKKSWWQRLAAWYMEMGELQQ